MDENEERNIRTQNREICGRITAERHRWHHWQEGCPRRHLHLPTHNNNDKGDEDNDDDDEDENDENDDDDDDKPGGPKRSLRPMQAFLSVQIQPPS